MKEEQEMKNLVVQISNIAFLLRIYVTDREFHPKNYQYWHSRC
jgi:hypothetical protein